MKWIIASDIHGSEYYCQKLLEAYKSEQGDRLLLLGDILYHGPRNDLSLQYNTRAVADMLNSIKEQIVCVRGNCGAEVDQMVLEFPIMADYALLTEGNSTIFATHGHIYNPDNLPLLHRGDVLLNGHTHVAECVEHENYVYINPGSVSLPKGDTWHGYMIMESGKFTWKDFDGNIKHIYALNGK